MPCLLGATEEVDEGHQEARRVTERQVTPQAKVEEVVAERARPPPDVR